MEFDSDGVAAVFPRCRSEARADRAVASGRERLREPRRRLLAGSRGCQGTSALPPANCRAVTWRPALDGRFLARDCWALSRGLTFMHRKPIMQRLGHQQRLRGPPGDGWLTAVDADGLTAVLVPSPRDLDFARKGRYLYAVSSGNAPTSSRVTGDRVGADGSLTEITSAPRRPNHRARPPRSRTAPGSSGRDSGSAPRRDSHREAP